MLYYILRSGTLVDEYDLQKAYEINTGNCYRYDDPAYSRWLYSLCGNSIISVKKDCEMTIDDFLASGSVIKAVREYRKRNGCTLREAKEAVDKMRGMGL